MYKSSIQYEILVACLLHSFYSNFKSFIYYPFVGYTGNTSINYIDYLTPIIGSGAKA